MQQRGAARGSAAAHAARAACRRNAARRGSEPPLRVKPPGQKLPAGGAGRRLCLRAASTKQKLPRWEDVRGPRQNTAGLTVTHFCAAGAEFERAPYLAPSFLSVLILAPTWPLAAAPGPCAGGVRPCRGSGGGLRSPPPTPRGEQNETSAPAEPRESSLDQRPHLPAELRAAGVCKAHRPGAAGQQARPG